MKFSRVRGVLVSRSGDFECVQASLVNAVAALASTSAAEAVAESVKLRHVNFLQLSTVLHA